MQRVLPAPNCFRKQHIEGKPQIEEIVLSSESEGTDEMPLLAPPLPSPINPPNEPVFSSESELEFSEVLLDGAEEHGAEEHGAEEHGTEEYGAEERQVAECGSNVSALNSLALTLQRWAYVRSTLTQPREIFLRIRGVSKQLRYISMAACPEAWLVLIGHACHRPFGDAQASEVYHALWNRADQAISRALAKLEKSKRKLEEIESEFKRREREVTRARAKHRRLNRNRIPANNGPS